MTLTSSAQLANLEDAPADVVDTEMSGLKVAIVKSNHAKCARCWHQREDVGSHAEHPELCGRCVENVDGGGETRQFA